MERRIFEKLLAWKDSEARKPLILDGARQVGKSTLFNTILENADAPALTLNCDEPEVKEMRASRLAEKVWRGIWPWCFSAILVID